MQLKETGTFYALKYMEIAKIVKTGAVDNILREFYLMEALSYYPLLVNVVFAFRDETHLYLGMDLMLGGDLCFHLKNARIVTEDMVRFWIAEVAVTIHYLHKRGIIHRDIKPQNLLIDAKGTLLSPYRPIFVYCVLSLNAHIHT